MPLRAGLILVLGFVELTVLLVLWRKFYDHQRQTMSPLNTETKHDEGGNVLKPLNVTKQLIITAVATNKVTMCLFQRRISDICNILSSEENENKLVYQNIYRILNTVMINPNCWLTSLVQNCALFRFAHGYDDKPVTQEELAFPLAFGIRMHKSAEQAEQLLRSIYRPHNVYCIHVDMKAKNSVFEIIKNISRCFKNIFVIEDRESIVYSGSGVIKAEMKCMLACLNSGIKWKYYLNLSGQEFPLRTNLEIVMILKLFQGANDIEAYDYPKHQEERFKKRYISSGYRLVKTHIDKPPFGYNIQMSKGSAYGMFSRRFAEFLLTDDVANKLTKWLDDTCSPEENIWSTLNSLPWAPGGYYVETRHSSNTHASRSLIWRWDKVKCYGRFIRSVCVFSFKDLPWLKSQPHVIANKFDINDVDRVVVDCLESMLLKRIHHPLLQTVDRNYFMNLPQLRFYRKLNETMKSTRFLNQVKQKWMKEHPWKIF
ncbi:beta-1,3-galactosyl-O-glycosyl-glycoprotein beta-1,6-N-acetylglucosaminyltransferase-like [Gigantopelta aegis]|uniref:beta-1,3-galactosyl-O-glycosyl-glycoprotein beta-1,6-N-acetylglucosaminyltransferase-like n=1 Tax=Gigantopelta aegis TaxID=1735272 RepID=UPI001B888AF8|nr:beta-1,3-galactosyl-O-glycosyl-glycoprotein beta-1,6-N-acetylglucosaminyltransferase-like [Gigantopelta aegis]